MGTLVLALAVLFFKGEKNVIMLLAVSRVCGSKSQNIFVLNYVSSIFYQKISTILPMSFKGTQTTTTFSGPAKTSKAGDCRMTSVSKTVAACQVVIS